MKVKQTCPNCGGRGRLPALGDVASNPRDMTRHFERPCRMEDGGCDGTGWRWVEVSFAEGSALALAMAPVIERLKRRL